jgi:hypothetical protein
MQENAFVNWTEKLSPPTFFRVGLRCFSNLERSFAILCLLYTVLIGAIYHISYKILNFYHHNTNKSELDHLQ